MIVTSVAPVKQGRLPLDRADRYADMLFIEALRTREQKEVAVSRFGDRVPLLVSMVEGGDTRGFADRMMNFPDLQALLGTQMILEQGRRWEQLERAGGVSQ